VDTSCLRFLRYAISALEPSRRLLVLLVLTSRRGARQR
jgi:hypothetical protein